MEIITTLLNSINSCLVPKLAKNYDESNDHPEFSLRNRTLVSNFQSFVVCLGNIRKADLEKHPQAIASMLILYKELSLDFPWNESKFKDLAKQLNTLFEVITMVHLQEVLCKNTVFEVQIVYEKCLESIHSKLTYDTFKMYPAQIEVYISLLDDLQIQELDIELVPTKIFPLAIFLMEDYSVLYKKKGLQCCSILLKLLHIRDFQNGNYYEVIYRSVKKNLGDKDIDILNLTHSCLLALVQFIPNDNKADIFDELYPIVLDKLLTDSNLHKKALCFNFASTIIQGHKENCVNRKEFKQIVCDNLDTCTNDAVSGIILGPLLKCLEEWVIYCWPVWKFKVDHKMIVSLFKVLYICKDDNLMKKIHKLIVTFFNLCTSLEKEQILKSFDKKRETQCELFSSKLNKLKADLV